MPRVYVVTFVHATDERQNEHEVFTTPAAALFALAAVANKHTKKKSVRAAFNHGPDNYQDAIDLFAEECKADNSHQLYVSECDLKPGHTVPVPEPEIPQPYTQDSGEPNSILAGIIQNAITQVLAYAPPLEGVTGVEIALIHSYAARQLARQADHAADELWKTALQQAKR
jgi:hypothetical protein